MKQYRLSFGALKDGIHRFEYKVDQDFFSLKQNSLIAESEINVELLLTKGRVIECELIFSGWYLSDCDNCLNGIKVPIKGKDSWMIKFGSEVKPLEDGVIILRAGDIEVDLYDVFYEAFCLNLPMRVYCEMSLNRPPCESWQNEEEPEQNETDPRWDKLKDLIKKK